MRRRIASAGPLASQSLSSDRRFLRLFEPHPSTPPNIRSVRRDKDPCATLAGTVLSQTLAMFQPALALVPPISWMMIGRNRFACFNFAAVMVLATPSAKLPQKRNRIVVCLFMFVLTSVSIIPFLAPAFNRSYLAGLKTRLDSDGICRQ